MGSRCLFFGKASAPMRAIHVEDAALAIVHVWTTTTIPCGEPYHLNHPDQVPLRRVGEMIRQATGLKPLFAGRLLGHCLGLMTRISFRLLKRGPRHSTRQISYLFSSAEVAPSRLLEFGWKPGLPLESQLAADLSLSRGASSETLSLSQETPVAK